MREQQRYAWTSLKSCIWIHGLRDDPETGLQLMPEERVFARRIVAALNAVAGMNTEALERGAMKELIKAIRRIVPEAEAEEEADSQGWTYWEIERGDIGSLRNTLEALTGPEATVEKK